MARPKKQTVDYFPHSCTHKKTMFILEQKYGNDGYAFWFKLLEMLGSTEGHFLNLKDDMEWEFLIAKTHLDREKCNEILNLLANLNAIDKKLWFKKNIVWSDNFIANIKEAYRNRTEDIPVKPSFLRKKSTSKGINDVKKPHTILKETILKETKLKKNITEIVSYLNLKTEKNFKDTATKTISLIKARLNEGFNIDDFKKVIDIKTAKWKSDPKMCDFLRPETLFGTKFESYLQEKPGSDWENWEKGK